MHYSRPGVELHHVKLHHFVRTCPRSVRLLHTVRRETVVECGRLCHVSPFRFVGLVTSSYFHVQRLSSLVSFNLSSSHTMPIRGSSSYVNFFCIPTRMSFIMRVLSAYRLLQLLHAKNFSSIRYPCSDQQLCEDIAICYTQPEGEGRAIRL